MSSSTVWPVGRVWIWACTGTLSFPPFPAPRDFITAWRNVMTRIPRGACSGGERRLEAGGERRGGRAAQVSPIFALPLSSADSHTARLRCTQFKHSSQVLSLSPHTVFIIPFLLLFLRCLIVIDYAYIYMWIVNVLGFPGSKWHFFIQATKRLYMPPTLCNQGQRFKSWPRPAKSKFQIKEQRVTKICRHNVLAKVQGITFGQSDV